MNEIKINNELRDLSRIITMSLATLMVAFMVINEFSGKYTIIYFIAGLIMLAISPIVHYMNHWKVEYNDSQLTLHFPFEKPETLQYCDIISVQHEIYAINTVKHDDLVISSEKTAVRLKGSLCDYSGLEKAIEQYIASANEVQEVL